MSFEGMSDETLMAEYLAGDVDALAFLLKRLLPQLVSIARSFSPNREFADDALQEALTTVWRKAESFSGDSKVTTWLFTIIRNACIDLYRKEQVRTKLNVSDDVLVEQPGGTDFADKSATEMAVRRAVLQLPDDLRDPVTLVFLNQLSVEEASQVLGIPEGTIKSRCSRGKAALAELLSELRTSP